MVLVVNMNELSLFTLLQFTPTYVLIIIHFCRQNLTSLCRFNTKHHTYFTISSLEIKQQLNIEM